jgi:hypothetical protein
VMGMTFWCSVVLGIRDWGLDWERRSGARECCLPVTSHLTRLKIAKSQACDWTPVPVASCTRRPSRAYETSTFFHLFLALHNASFQTGLSHPLHSEKIIQLLTHLPLSKVDLKIRSISRKTLHHYGGISRNRRSDCKAVCRRRR